MGRAETVWAELNERQRLYLLTIFNFDQRAEADIKARSANWQKVPPASVWRQITYDIKLPKDLAGYSSVQSELRQAGQHDFGAGSSLAALERRGLVTVTHDLVPVMARLVPRVRVRLTPLGRAAARAGAGRTGPATVPKGLMGQWSFDALARLYAAGEPGLGIYSRGTPSWNTLLRLRDRRDANFLDEFGNGGVRLSTEGQRHYEIHYACYRQLYPDINAPAPAEANPEAHTGLDDHRPGRRPRGLVSDTDLRVLVELADLHDTGRSFLRRVMTEAYERSREGAPEDVRAIPPGLLRWQVKNIARSEKPIDRLAAHPSGPLIEVVTVANLPDNLATKPTLDLVVLTQHGREHLARHHDDYRRAYPDVELPDRAPS